MNNSMHSRRSFLQVALSAIGLAPLLARFVGNANAAESKRFKITLKWIGPAWLCFRDGIDTTNIHVDEGGEYVYFEDTYTTGDVTIKADSRDWSIDVCSSERFWSG